MECIEEECSPQETFCNGISKKENFGGFSINKNAKQGTVKSRVISPSLFPSYFKLKILLLPIFYAVKDNVRSENVRSFDSGK